ncbi:ABC transporter ATP-binding protein [Pontibacillus salicampi]|uniref:ABC transporter ATP-binding protein n=1 Tax=Pontibacillus salicampi TaxID=1449801 RepID=A0ABV6LPG0_9BACI
MRYFRNPSQRRKPPSIQQGKKTLRHMWHYLLGEKVKLTVVLLLVGISSVLALLGPYLLGLTVDSAVSKAPTTTIGWMLLALLSLYGVQYGAILLQNYWMIGIAQNTIYHMRKDLYQHFQQVKLAYFQSNQHGDLMSRATNDLENVSKTLNSSVIQFTTSIITLLGTAGMMFWISPLLTILTLTIVPVLVIGMKWITKRTGRYYKEQQLYLGEMNGFVEESLTGHEVITLFGRQEQTVNEFQQKNEAYRHSSYWAQTYTGFIPKLMNMLNNVSFAVIVGVGGVFVVKGWVSIGMIVTFTTYSRQFTRPLNDLANQYNTILSAIAGAERVFRVMDEPTEMEEGDGIQVSQLTGHVAFQGVTFCYEGEQETISNVTFQAKPGESIALIGPTGAGKSTIISLLAGFYLPQDGSIMLDGFPLRQLDRRSVRNCIGTVLQDSFLFSTTIRENIRYGRLNATNEEVEEAAYLANAHSFIVQLPLGYDTLIHPDGQSISHGQRQLISIARAMLANPDILILDEATNSVDTITENKINEALHTLMKGRTSFVIAHRLHTIRSADQILVLDQGEIVEQGTHQSLLEENGMYKALLKQQLSTNI